MPSVDPLEKEPLVELYHVEEMASRDVANELGVSKSYVLSEMDRHGIETRTRGEHTNSVLVECENCGIEKKIPVCHYKSHDRFFCDNECQGEDIQKTGRYDGELGPRWKGKVSVDCAWCGSSKEIYPSRIGTVSNHFCNEECHNKWRSVNQRGENHHQYAGGGGDGWYGPVFRRVRKKVAKRDNYTCQRCGLNRDELDREPAAHHIRPVRTFDEPVDAHTMDNLVLVCTSCHGRVEQLTTEEQYEMFGELDQWT